MEWTTIQPAVEIPHTGNPWIDYILGAIIPLGLGIIYLLVKWLRTYLKNKIRQQQIKEQEIKNGK